MDRLPPGEARICRVVESPKKGGWAYVQRTPVEIKPGQTTRVTIGGKGRPVVGRVVAPTGFDRKIDWSEGAHLLRRNMPQPEIPGLRELAQKDRDKAQAMYVAWQKSDAGKAYLRAQYNDSVYLKPDGSFRIEDVPAGSYKLPIHIREPLAPGQRSRPKMIGSITFAFEVPDMPGGRSDEPLDLGARELNIHGQLNVGDSAPDFAVKTVDGKPLKLSDFRGKLVLLDFWATWCGPCVRETPNLKAAWNKFGKHGKFVIIGLSFDQTTAKPRDYAQKKQLGWVQGFVPGGFGSKVAADYGVTGIPSIFLIGSDGKILAKRLRGGRIVAEVGKALENMPAAK